MNRPENKFDRWPEGIPDALASRTSIIIFLVLFIYLVVYTILCLSIPALRDMLPDNNWQTVLANYVGILSALGAAIAASSSVSAHRKIKELHERHDRLRDSMLSLHDKIDKLNGLH